MSKVISFSISDKYLEKLRTLYPALTDNLAVKQFVTDGLDGSLGNSLDGSLDDGLDDRVKTLIESWVDGLLDERLDATVGKLITSLSERMARLEERLDDSLDGRLDDMERLLRLQREASIATSPIVEPTGETSHDEPDQPAIGTVTREVSPSPPDRPAIETLTSESDSSIEGEDAIETLTPEVSSSPLDRPAIGTLPTVETGIDSVESGSDTEPVKEAIETVTGDSKPWYTLKELLDCHYFNWPSTRQGLQKKADREHWPKRKRKDSQVYEYQAILPH